MGSGNGRCLGCGAAIPHPRPLACSYCGTAVPRAGRAAGGPAARRGARLARVVDHPRLSELLELTPPHGRFYAGFGCGLVFVLVWTGVATFMTVMATRMDSAFVALMPALFVLIGLAAGVVFAVKARRFARAPLLRVPAVVVDKRSTVSRRGSSRSVIHHVLLEFEDGDRQEYRSQDATSAELAPEDAGVAYLKDTFLLDFRRLDVD